MSPKRVRFIARRRVVAAHRLQSFWCMNLVTESIDTDARSYLQLPHTMTAPIPSSPRSSASERFRAARRLAPRVCGAKIVRRDSSSEARGWCSGKHLSDQAWCSWVDVSGCGDQSLRDSADLVEDAIGGRFARRRMAIRVQVAASFGSGSYRRLGSVPPR
jgi:hypothetical protein